MRFAAELAKEYPETDDGTSPLAADPSRTLGETNGDVPFADFFNSVDRFWRLLVAGGGMRETGATLFCGPAPRTAAGKLGASGSPLGSSRWRPVLGSLLTEGGVCLLSLMGRSSRVGEREPCCLGRIEPVRKPVSSGPASR